MRFDKSRKAETTNQSPIEVSSAKELLEAMKSSGNLLKSLKNNGGLQRVICPRR